MFPVSLFFPSSVFCPVLHPLWVHRLLGMGLGGSPSVSQSLSFFSLSLALMHADPVVVGFWSLFDNNISWMNLCQ